MPTLDQTHLNYGKLLTHLRTLESAVLAFSGGVDSSFLLVALLESGIDFLAVTALSPTMPAHDRQDVETLVRDLGIKQHRILESHELKDKNFVQNPSNRCYFCKKHLFETLSQLAKNEGFATVLDGSTLDDLNDYRPGTLAKQQSHVQSPLQEAGLSKQEIRLLAREKGFPWWDKPASPCLSSRIPYGDAIDVLSLQKVDRAEDALKKLGFQELRVRKYQETATIEIPEAEINKIVQPELRKQITALLLEIGFKYVTLDLEGFKSGKLNRVIPIGAPGQQSENT